VSPSIQSGRAFVRPRVYAELKQLNTFVRRWQAWYKVVSFSRNVHLTTIPGYEYVQQQRDFAINRGEISNRLDLEAHDLVH